MMKTQRLLELTNHIMREEVVSLAKLCEIFGTSSATMHRDLNDLESQGLIKRVHGGARSANSKANVFEPPYAKRMVQNVKEKKRIADYAMNYIHDGDTIFLDSSTTVGELANCIALSNLKIMVITNDIHIGCILQDCPNIELLIIGGLIRSSFYSTRGVFAENMLTQLRANTFFIAVDAIHPQHGARIFHVDELNCKHLMLERSQKHYVLCDHTKFFESAAVQICPITSINAIITDNDLGDEVAGSFRQFIDLELIRI
jgi:DeoR/GlpR family transcriptional regulator of sugar metabolism